MTKRLTKVAWIRHGLASLSEEGPDAINVGRLATGLDVSRGSFYWHFADIADYRSALLDAWEKSMTDAVIFQLKDESGADRLSLLLKQAFEADRKLEMALRSWAANDSKVARVVGKVDQRRISYIATLLIESGVAEDVANSRSTFTYWAYLGQSLATLESHKSISLHAIEDLAALIESQGSQR